MGLGGNASVQCHLDSTKHGLFIVLQDESEDLRHLTVTAGPPEEMALQLPEGIGQVGKGRPVAQGARLALDHRKIMPPVIDRSPWQVMGALDDPGMLTQNLSLGGDDNPLGVDPEAHRPVGE